MVFTIVLKMSLLVTFKTNPFCFSGGILEYRDFYNYSASVKLNVMELKFFSEKYFSLPEDYAVFVFVCKCCITYKF